MTRFIRDGHKQVVDLTRHANLRLVFTMAAIVLAAGCSGQAMPRVEMMENGVYVRKTVRTYDITGARDGATTHASATIALDGGDTLRVDLNVSYNPTPELASGHWRIQGKTPEEGDVQAESIKFLGGQGASPGVGGRFRLESFGNPRMRVVLPARPLEHPLP